MKYDYLIVGSGFFGSTFARLMTDVGKKCFIIDSRKHIGGNAYSKKNEEGIDIHQYGPHIFHTNDDDIWNFINRFTKFNNFVNCPKVHVNGRLYSLPFNMNTFYEIWGCTTPEQAKKIIDAQKLTLNREPANLEEQALSMVGKDIYELLIKDYTEKQWKKHPKDLPAEIIKRLPLRFTFNNNYFNDKYQGIPIDGYDTLFENMLCDIPVNLNTNFFDIKDWTDLAHNLVFTGKIDEFFNYKHGELEYRTLEFHHETLNIDNFQGNAVINYPDSSVEYTRIIEHKHFNSKNTQKTVITKEVPVDWDRTKIPYYPVDDSRNRQIYKLYKKEAENRQDIIFGGRLAEYRYYNMDQIIASATKKVKTALSKR